jgi:hypothetical protein
MSDVTFYHSERADGGQRTGLLIDGDRALERFVPGSEESDPRLLWSIDVTVPVSDAPATQEAAADWMGQHHTDFKRILERTAEEIEAGIDVDTLGWIWEDQRAEPPFRVSISAVRRFAALDIAKRIRGLTASWDDLRRGLAQYAELERSWARE